VTSASAAFANAVAAIVDEIAARDGAIDFMFNNAGLSMGGPTHELSGAHWDRIIDVNLRGVVHGLLAAYPG
jgi:NADP-dependent 3-hydroxy acid dehydrogenase YdfG